MKESDNFIGSNREKSNTATARFKILNNLMAP